eukprot:c6949_g1_i1.p1 GENE.c6949_g1_i1~~c6949_g1_i1.p1  ORF type:complete len:505 (+),score=113.08 c6949_g1_i1:1-1515(+)
MGSASTTKDDEAVPENDVLVSPAIQQTTPQQYLSQPHALQPHLALQLPPSVIAAEHFDQVPRPPSPVTSTLPPSIAPNIPLTAADLFDKDRSSNKPSHWSDEEKDTFLRLFNQRGRDWKGISAALGTKTPNQVRNFFQNYKVKLNLNASLPAQRSIKKDPSQKRRKDDGRGGDDSSSRKRSRKKETAEHVDSEHKSVLKEPDSMAGVGLGGVGVGVVLGTPVPENVALANFAQGLPIPRDGSLAYSQLQMILNRSTVPRPVDDPTEDDGPRLPNITNIFDPRGNRIRRLLDASALLNLSRNLQPPLLVPQQPQVPVTPTSTQTQSQTAVQIQQPNPSSPPARSQTVLPSLPNQSQQISSLPLTPLQAIHSPQSSPNITQSIQESAQFVVTNPLTIHSDPQQTVPVLGIPVAHSPTIHFAAHEITLNPQVASLLEPLVTQNPPTPPQPSPHTSPITQASQPPPPPDQQQQSSPLEVTTNQDTMDTEELDPHEDAPPSVHPFSYLS